MNVNRKERLVDHTKPGRERMSLTHEAKGHEIPVALGNTVATGASDSTGATNSFQHVCITLAANWTGVGATGDGVVVLQLTERVERRDEYLGDLMLSTSSHMAVGGSREAAYASTASLHASPVV